MIVEMFTIQNSLNTKSYDTAWIEKGKTEEFDYAMAAGDETHEFLRSIPFEWWKKTAADRQNQVTELVDAWHFIMSQMIIDADGDVDAAIKEAEVSFGHVMTLDMPSITVKKQAKRFVAAMYLNNSDVVSGLEYSDEFFKLCRVAEVPINLLYARYLAKATLNKFRVANGYKTGQYLKMWNLDSGPQEDNFYLSRWVDQRLLQGHTADEYDVSLFLTAIYDMAKNAAANAAT